MTQGEAEQRQNFIVSCQFDVVLLFQLHIYHTNWSDHLRCCQSNISHESSRASCDVTCSLLDKKLATNGCECAGSALEASGRFETNIKEPDERWGYV